MGRVTKSATKSAQTVERGAITPELTPIMTLDVAQRLGVVTAMQAYAQAKRDTEQAKGREERAQLIAAEVFESLNLNPSLVYPIDDQGNVYAPKT